VDLVFRHLFALFFALSCFQSGSIYAQQDLKIPALSKNGKTLADFVPRGWSVKARAEGDLNKDGRNDVAAILIFDGENSGKEKFEDYPRLLVFLLRQPDDTLQLSAASDQVILGKNMGGVYGDPFQSLKIEHGTVVVNHYGGSREKWGNVYRFRYQEGDWFLIGKTIFTSDSLSRKKDTTDTNLLTGKVIETKVTANGKSTVIEKTLPRKSLTSLSSPDFASELSR
jgi:hypothetical protein